MANGMSYKHMAVRGQQPYACHDQLSGLYAVQAAIYNIYVYVYIYIYTGTYITYNFYRRRYA